MGNSFESLQAELGDQLERAAIAYLRTGLSLFHEATKSPIPSYQPAVGNLSIAVELLLKTVIARKAFRFLYTNLPLEAQVYLSNPATVPDATAFRRYAIDLRTFKYKTPDLDRCISLFYIFFPTDKPEFRPYLSFLSRVRNNSVHAALPAFQMYDLYRVAYAALKLFERLEDDGAVTKCAYLLTGEDKKFLEQYDVERVKRVERALEEAKKKSKTLKHLGASVFVEGNWEEFTTVCPVCGADGLLSGYTDVHGEFEDMSLGFDADMFECEDCGLKLHDVEELKIAGMETVYDRNEEWDDWMAEGNGDEYY